MPNTETLEEWTRPRSPSFKAQAGLKTRFSASWSSALYCTLPELLHLRRVVFFLTQGYLGLKGLGSIPWGVCFLLADIKRTEPSKLSFLSSFSFCCSWCLPTSISLSGSVWLLSWSLLLTKYLRFWSFALFRRCTSLHFPYSHPLCSLIQISRLCRGERKFFFSLQSF